MQKDETQRSSASPTESQILEKLHSIKYEQKYNWAKVYTLNVYKPETEKTIFIATVCTPRVIRPAYN